MQVAFVGEALIDFTGSPARPLAFQGHAGGSPLNAAVACARLGVPTAYLTQLSTDLFGEQLLGHLQANGIDTSLVTRSSAPSTLAFVERGDRTNRYAFFTTGSADAAWSPQPVPRLPTTCRALHFGSISLLREPGATAITALVRAHAGRLIVVFDPNVRLGLIDDLPAYRERFDTWRRLATVLKLSDEDVAALAPGGPPVEAAAQWLRQGDEPGPSAAVVTQGGQGATLLRRGRPPMPVPAPAVTVRDTIGAGDTFGAALTVALLEAGVGTDADLQALDDAAWRAALEFAAAAAALNCEREGADPPDRSAVTAALAGRR